MPMKFPTNMVVAISGENHQKLSTLDTMNSRGKQDYTTWKKVKSRRQNNIYERRSSLTL